MGVAVAAGAALCALPALALGVTTGSPAALRLARQVLAQVRNHETAVQFSESGGFFMCPRAHSFPILVTAGRRPRAGCRAGHLTVEQNLRAGAVIAQHLVESAHGLATVRGLIASGSYWLNHGRSGCWRRTGPARQFAAVSYGGERLSLGRPTATTETLIGTVIRGNGHELDTVRRSDHAIESVRITQRVAHLGVSRSVQHFHYPSAQFAMPAPTPVC